MITGAAVFQTLHSLSRVLNSRERERMAEIDRVNYDLRSQEVSFDGIVAPHAAAIRRLPSVREFPVSFEKRLAECRVRVDAAADTVKALERDRESMLGRLEDEKSASPIASDMLRKYQSRVSAAADIGHAVGSRHRKLEKYHRQARKVEDFATTLRARRSGKIFGFLFDRRSASQLSRAENAISEWKVFIDEYRADLSRTEEGYIEAKRALNIMVAENGAALRETDAMMKAHGEIIAMASRNLDAARSEKAAAEHELACLTDAQDGELVRWLRDRLLGEPSVRSQILGEIASAGILDGAVTGKLDEVLSDIGRLQAHRGRLEDDLTSVRAVSEARREAALALAKNGWTRSKELFPGVSLPDLGEISTGHSCEEILGKVGTIAIACSPSFRTEGADKTDVRRPPAYPFH